MDGVTTPSSSRDQSSAQEYPYPDECRHNHTGDLQAPCSQPQKPCAGEGRSTPYDPSLYFAHLVGSANGDSTSSSQPSSSSSPPLDRSNASEQGRHANQNASDSTAANSSFPAQTHPNNGSGLHQTSRTSTLFQTRADPLDVASLHYKGKGKGKSPAYQNQTNSLSDPARETMDTKTVSADSVKTAHAEESAPQTEALETESRHRSTNLDGGNHQRSISAIGHRKHEKQALVARRAKEMKGMDAPENPPPPPAHNETTPPPHHPRILRLALMIICRHVEASL